MRSLMRVCRSDGTYTLGDACPTCGTPTVTPLPPRYSPEDRYGKYRRRLKQQGAA